MDIVVQFRANIVDILSIIWLRPTSPGPLVEADMGRIEDKIAESLPPGVQLILLGPLWHRNGTRVLQKGTFGTHLATYGLHETRQ